MNIFENRLQSFHTNQRKWPHQARVVSIETLAKSGFFFAPAPSQGDSVQCFLCDARLNRWRNDDAMERHKRMAPDCPWVILSFPDLQRANATTTDAKSTRLASARVRTFKKGTSWPPKSMARQQLPTAKKLADAGFYYAPTPNCVDRVACAYCLATITGMDRSTDLLTQHESSCTFFAKTDNQGPITRLRAARTTSPEVSLKRPDKKPSLDDSIWDIGKAYVKQDRARMTYAKRMLQPGPILPKHLTGPVHHPSSPRRSASLDKTGAGEKQRASADKAKQRVSTDKAKQRASVSKEKQRVSVDKEKQKTVPKKSVNTEAMATSAPAMATSAPAMASSTPLRNSPFLLDDDNDLESLTLSPIRPAASFRPPVLQGIMQSTPNTQVARVKRSVLHDDDDDDDDDDHDDDEDPRKRLKPFSPPSSPTRPTARLINSASLWIPEDEVQDAVAEAELDMTVEQYINSLVKKEIQHIQSTSEEWIDQIRAKVDQIRHTLTNA